MMFMFFQYGKTAAGGSSFWGEISSNSFSVLVNAAFDFYSWSPEITPHQFLTTTPVLGAAHLNFLCGNAVTNLSMGAAPPGMNPPAWAVDRLAAY